MQSICNYICKFAEMILNLMEKAYVHEAKVYDEESNLLGNMGCTRGGGLFWLGTPLHSELEIDSCVNPE